MQVLTRPVDLELGTEVAELYVKAAQLIVDRGLSHGHYQDSNGHVCTVGALRLSVGASADPLDTYKGLYKTPRVYNVAYDLLSDHVVGHSVTRWSDASTVDEVVTTLRNLAAQLKERS